MGEILDAIAGSTPIVGQVANAAIQAHQNKKTREWNEKMYGVQRKDALSDWQMQNAYNSPAAQMQRLREAGLNPNLVYGHGADAQGGIVRSTDVKSWNPTAPSFAPEAAIGTYLDAKVKQLQTDNLAMQKTLMEQDLKNKMATEFKTYADAYKSESQRDYTDTQTQLKGVDLNYATRIKEMSLQGMQASIDKAMSDIDLTQSRTTGQMQENEFRAISNDQTIAQNAIKILQMRENYLQSLKINPANLEYRKQQIEQVRQQIQKIKNDAEGSGEKARILKSTPNYLGQKGVGVISDLIGNLGKPKGLYLKPNESIVNRRTGELRRR